MTTQLIDQGFSHVERDDRLLDIFPKATPEKGVELWEKWGKDTVEIVRIHSGKQSQYQFSRAHIEQALMQQQQLTLV